MFCPKCGSQMPDGSNFCTSCGEKLSAPAPAAEPVNVSSQDPAPIPEPTPMPEPAPVPEPTPMPETAPVPAPEAPTYTAPVAPIQEPIPPYPPVPAAPQEAAPETGFVQPRQGGGNKKIIAIAGAAAAALIIIIVAVVGVTSLFSSSNGGNSYAYLSDGKYGLITNLKKGQTLEIASSRSEDASVMNSNLLAFSPDGKYVYYYTKYDSSSNTGSLCRAEYGKLKSDPSKNDKYIETIASNAALGFRFLDDGSLTYMNGDHTLYWYNGKEPVQVAKNVSYYYTDGSKRLIYVTMSSGDSGSMIYGADLEDVDNKVKLASNIAYISMGPEVNFDNILYFKMEDDGAQTLYSVGFDKEAEKLGQGVSDLSWGGGKVYFSAENGETISLYDFVDDPNASEDAGLIEPKAEDFSIPSYSYDMVYGTNLSESDYDDLYTSCTRELYWYGSSTWWCYSMEDALSRDWGAKNKEIAAATKSFIDRFGDTADEFGYIKVTDEVKAALKEIAQYGNDTKGDSWLLLCYNRHQSGTTTDYEAYDAAQKKWYEARDRIEARKTLQDKENDFHVLSLYCYDKGKLTPVCDNVMGTSSCSGGILYATTDMITEKASIDDVYSSSDVTKLFGIDFAQGSGVLLTENGQLCELSQQAADTLADTEGSYGTLYLTGDKAFIAVDGELSVAAISGGSVGSFSLVSDDARVQMQKDGKLYYTSGSYENNYTTYGDLYVYEKGESTRLARDVLLGGGINIYEDGAILAYTGYREIYGYELSMINAKGESTIVAENVTQYIRVDKSTLLYISDGDLYLYNGKEKSMVETGVDWLWVKESMDFDTVVNWNSGY